MSVSTQRREQKRRAVVVEERRPDGRHRTRTISVLAADVRRGRSPAAIAQAERLFAAAQLQIARPSAEAVVGGEHEQHQEAEVGVEK